MLFNRQAEANTRLLLDTISFQCYLIPILAVEEKAFGLIKLIVLNKMQVTCSKIF